MTDEDIVKAVTAKLTGEFYVGQRLRVGATRPWTAIVVAVDRYDVVLCEEGKMDNPSTYDAFTIRKSSTPL